MSKIAYFVIPAHGHVNPTLPVVQELIRRGEEVIYYNTEEFRELSEQTGATLRAYPKTELSSATISRLLAHGNLANITALYLRVTRELLPFALAEVAAVQPDLIMMDAGAMWAKMAATLAGRPSIATIPHFIFDGAYDWRTVPRPFLQLVQWLPLVPVIFWQRFLLTRRYGAAAFPPMPPLLPMRGELNISFTARALHPKSPVIDNTFRFVGPSIDPQTRNTDYPFEALDERPLIYLSLGTVHSRRPTFYRDCLDAFATMNAQFVLAVGHGTDIERVRPVPANFIVRNFVPQLEVLARADLFVTHGGLNSIHEALYYGTPLVLIPHQIEQYFNALSVQEWGAGVVIEGQIRRGEIAIAQVRQAVEEMLAQPQYRTAARKVQHVLRATGGYCEAADEIQAFLAQI